MGKVIKGFVGRAVTVVTAAMVLNGVAMADVKPTPAEQYLMSKGVKITQSFQSVSGLKAIVADNGKEKRLFYVTPDGKSVIAGTVFDTAGVSVTARDMDRVGMVGGPAAGDVQNAVTASQTAQYWARAEKLHWIQDGTGQKVIYAIFDPNCPYCHRLWTTLRGAVMAGKVQVRWLPVAILKESSKGLGAAIYAAQDKSVALQQMANYQLRPVDVSQAANRDMAYNLLLLRDTGFTGVPTVLYKKGNAVHITMGVPTDSELAALLN